MTARAVYLVSLRISRANGIGRIKIKVQVSVTGLSGFFLRKKFNVTRALVAVAVVVVTAALAVTVTKPLLMKRESVD